MTRQQYADELLHHWQLLWPLGAEERRRRFSEIIADYEYEEVLTSVQTAMLEPLPVPHLTPADRPATAAWAGALVLNFSAIVFGGYMIWQMIR